METVLIIIIFMLLMACCGAGGFFLWKKWSKLEQSHEYLNQQMRILVKSNLGIGGRVSDLEARLEKLDYKQEDLEERQPEDVAYSHAAKLVELGADVDELVKSCGLSKGEAEFLLTMHKKDPGSA